MAISMIAGQGTLLWLNDDYITLSKRLCWRMCIT